MSDSWADGDLTAKDANHAKTECPKILDGQRRSVSTKL